MDMETYMKQLTFVLNKATRNDMVEWGKLLHQQDHFTSIQEATLP